MTAIATVTQGDWQYIDEWIQHHLDIGVDLILIAYNGNYKDWDRLPKYDKVRYLDFSYNENMPASGYHNAANRKGLFSGWCNPGTSIYNMRYQQRVYNILLDIVRYTYPEIKYLTFIDTDEFIIIKREDFNNDINVMLSKIFPEWNSSFLLPMVFYHDNELIYNDGRPCVERFINEANADTNYVTSCNFGMKKIVINLYHEDVRNNKCRMLSPHHCELAYEKYTFNYADVELAHFYSKTLEEWISKMNPEIDGDYFERFRHILVSEFFHHGNTLTDEKLRAIPGLLKKYNIDYRPELEDTNEEIRQKYIEANNIQL